MGPLTYHAVSNLAKAPLELIPASIFVLLMARIDVRANRVPNYLTAACALAALTYQAGFHGWRGLVDGFLGIGLGFALLVFFYWRGGLGAGDVKALAALGGWLGPLQTLYLFILSAFCGVMVMTFFLWRRGLLGEKIRQIKVLLVTLVLVIFSPGLYWSKTARSTYGEKIPYTVCMAMGMFCLVLIRLFRLVPGP